MTEEIIIDCVNVAECPHKKKEVTFMNVIKCYNYGACEGVNCLYKQLKRLEQENKELKIVKEQLKKWNDENLRRQDDMQLWIDLAEEQRKKYRSALEEIMSFCTKDFVTDEELKKQLNNKWLPKFAKGSATERNRRKYIINKINEVL